MNLDLRFYWSLFLRRLPVMLALVLVFSAFGLVIAVNRPPVFQTSARLLVEAAQIPDSMAASTVRTDASEQLQVIEQQLLTRANLIDIANKFGVFENIGGMTPDAVASAMRSQTDLRRTGGRDQATLMTLTFTAREGRIAANVVNEYVTLILEKANDFRISRVENTLEFFEQEVERLGANLDAQSSEIVAFKNENADALPDDLNFRLGRQALLQERLGRLERDKAALQQQRAEILRIFEQTGQIRVNQEKPLTPEEQQLRSLQAEMRQARAVFSESNPRIRLLQNQIDTLETQIASAGSAGQDGAQSSSDAMLQVSMSEIDSRLASLEDELADSVAEMNTLEDSIAATSSIAIQLNTLERDYENIQVRYNGAVNNLNTARMGERIEVSSQGQRISVIEGANVPSSPSGPNRPKIAAAGIGAGFGLAAAYFFLLEVLNRRIRTPAELQSRFNIVPIATIPYMETRQHRMMRRGALVGAFLLVLFGVPAVLWYINESYMPLDLLAEKIIDRFGV